MSVPMKAKHYTLYVTENETPEKMSQAKCVYSFTTYMLYLVLVRPVSILLGDRNLFRNARQSAVIAGHLPPNSNHSEPIAHSSQFTVHWSQSTTHNPRITVHSTHFTDYTPQLIAHSSMLTDRSSPTPEVADMGFGNPS